MLNILESLQYVEYTRELQYVEYTREFTIC